jgi:hypothetical protein
MVAALPGGLLGLLLLLSVIPGELLESLLNIARDLRIVLVQLRENGLVIARNRVMRRLGGRIRVRRDRRTNGLAKV